MKFIVTCPGCSNRTNLEAQSAFGRRAKCKKCNLDFALEPINTREIPDLAAELLRKAEEGEHNLDRIHQPVQPPALPSLRPIEQSLSKELNLNRPPRVAQVFPKWMMTVQFAVGIVASVMITAASAVAILRNSQPAIKFTGNQQTREPVESMPLPAENEIKEPESEVANTLTFDFKSDAVIASLLLSGVKTSFSFEDDGTKVYTLDGVDCLLMLKDVNGKCEQITVGMSDSQLRVDRQYATLLFNLASALVAICGESNSLEAGRFIRSNIDMKAVGEKKVLKLDKVYGTLVVMDLKARRYVFFGIVPAN